LQRRCGTRREGDDVDVINVERVEKSRECAGLDCWVAFGGMLEPR
jgi:hypothetical protein